MQHGVGTDNTKQYSASKPVLYTPTPEIPVKTHISPYKPMEVTVTAQGNYFGVKVHNRAIQSKPAQSQRGAITGFSDKSRKRMIDQLSKLDKNKIRWGKHKPKFITLTYDTNMTDQNKAHRDLKVFIERLQESYPQFSCIWKLEYQKRGAIHFHLMVFGVPYMTIHDPHTPSNGWQNKWNTVAGISQSVRNSLDVQTIKSMNGVMFYAAKYMTKEVDNTLSDDNNDSTNKIPVSFSQYDTVSTVPIGAVSKGSRPMDLPMCHIFSKLKLSTGRFWGVYGRKNLPVAKQSVTRCVTSHFQMRKFAAYLDSPYARSANSYVIYADNAQKHYNVFLKQYNDALSDNISVWVKFKLDRRVANGHVFGAAKRCMWLVKQTKERLAAKAFSDFENALWVSLWGGVALTP